MDTFARRCYDTTNLNQIAVRAESDHILSSLPITPASIMDQIIVEFDPIDESVDHGNIGGYAFIIQGLCLKHVSPEGQIYYSEIADHVNDVLSLYVTVYSVDITYKPIENYLLHVKIVCGKKKID